MKTENLPQAIEAMPAGTEIEQTRRHIAITRAQLGNSVEALVYRLDFKSRMKDKARYKTAQAKQRTRRMSNQAIEFGQKNFAGLIVAAMGVIGSVVALMVWRKRR